ncbi:MAG: cell division protein FtsQ/DivIB [Cytophagales bacterium]|nr:cell division protein FtsQ/DivIB [Cytophagales bacterium]
MSFIAKIPNIRKLVKGMGLVISGAVVVIAIGFTEKKQSERTCQAIDIHVMGGGAQRFIEEHEMLYQLTSQCDPIYGVATKEVVTRKIENFIKSHNFVKKAVVYKNWKGKLKVKIVPRRPIARIIHSDGEDRYIDEEGKQLPLSDKYTARVVLISGTKWSSRGEDLTNSTYGAALLKLLHFIDRDPFWRAQIAQIYIDKKGEIIMDTQVGKQEVVFGKPENVENKLAKLKLFYEKILPYKGGDRYERVNLKFENQIACE